MKNALLLRLCRHQKYTKGNELIFSKTKKTQPQLIKNEKENQNSLMCRHELNLSHKIPYESLPTYFPGGLYRLVSLVLGQCVFILLPRSSCFSCVFASFSLNFFFFNWIKGTLNLIVLDNFQNCLLFLFPPDPFTYGVFTSGLRAVAPVTNSAHIQASALYCESSVTQSCQFFATPWTVAHQVSLCMGFFRQE